jgi:hypothetical protein
MTSFSESKFYCEYNGCNFVTKRFLVLEISRLGFVVKNWMWLKIFDKVKFWVKILLQIQRWYFHHQPTPVPEIGRLCKGAWPKIFDEVIFWIRILKRIQLLYFHHQATSGCGVMYLFIYLLCLASKHHTIIALKKLGTPQQLNSITVGPYRG